MIAAPSSPPPPPPGTRPRMYRDNSGSNIPLARVVLYGALPTLPRVIFSMKESGDSVECSV